MGVHDGHRKRLKNRFLRHGLEPFDDHQVLELLLFYAVPRVDTNGAAHTLLRTFGSLSEVFDAPVEELVKIPGVGENAATLIKLMPQISRRYSISKNSAAGILSTPSDAGKYLMPYFYGERDEVVYIVCLDAKCKVLACRMMFRGGVNSANVNVRKLVETALAHNATGVILAHNHTSGIALPSEEDRMTTRRVAEALSAVDVTLVDHIIVAEDDFISFKDSGLIK